MQKPPVARFHIRERRRFGRLCAAVYSGRWFEPPANHSIPTTNEVHPKVKLADGRRRQQESGAREEIPREEPLRGRHRGLSGGTSRKRRRTWKPRRCWAICIPDWISRTAPPFITATCSSCWWTRATNPRPWRSTIASCGIRCPRSHPNALRVTPSCSKNKIIPKKPSINTSRPRSCSARRTAWKTPCFAGSARRNWSRTI